MTDLMTYPALRPRESLRGARTVLVATDGTEQSDGALRVALARAEARDAPLEVLCVVPPEPPVSPEIPYATWSGSMLLRRNALREAVELQLVRVTGRDRGHPILLLDGHPARTIAHTAREQRATLIVVGLGRHKVSDRLFSDETALQLARISRVPVLAVPVSGRREPRHAVVAVDFSDLSLRAARAAVDAVGDHGRVDLVHVMPYLLEDSFAVESREPYERWVDGELGKLADQLVVPERVFVARVSLRGKPAPTLLSYAEKVHADLVCTGTHGRGFVARTLLGSVTSQLLRAATCCILTVPRDPLPEPVAITVDTGRTDESEWATGLTGFTSRNLGRRTVLEVDDLEIGAQAQESNYPLIATMYDPREHRLQIMLGDGGPSGRRLTRSIGGVSEVDVLTDGSGHDVALRIGHGTSQTLLTFPS